MRKSSKSAPQLLSDICLWAAGVLLIINVANIALGIFMRYLLKTSFIWTEEFSRYSLIWVVALAAPPALYHGDHMYIDFIVKRLPSSMQIPLIWFKRVVIGGVLAIMIYHGIKYTIEVKMFITMAMNISKAIPVSAIPVGMTLTLIEYILLEIRKDVSAK